MTTFFSIVLLLKVAVFLADAHGHRQHDDEVRRTSTKPNSHDFALALASDVVAGGSDQKKDKHTWDTDKNGEGIGIWDENDHWDSQGINSRHNGSYQHGHDHYDTHHDGNLSFRSRRFYSKLLRNAFTFWTLLVIACAAVTLLFSAFAFLQRSRRLRGRADALFIVSYQTGERFIILSGNRGEEVPSGTPV